MPVVENGHGEVNAPNFVASFNPNGDDDFFGGDVSSIMIRPDQLNDQNIANE